MGMYSVEDHSHMGNATGATCDGRKKGKALSNSMGPVQGMDTNGPTAMLNTLNRIDFSKATNGMVLDMKMTPTFLEKEDHLRKLRSLIETYFQRGGLELQISSVSRRNAAGRAGTSGAIREPGGPGIRVQRLFHQSVQGDTG